MDSLVICGSSVVSYVLFVGDYFDDVSYYAAAGAFVWLSALLLMNFGGLYQLDPIMRPLAFSDKIAIAFATTFLFLLAAAFALKISATFSRYWVASFALSSGVGTLTFRFFASRVVRVLAKKRVFTRNLVIAGSYAQIAKLLTHVEASKPRFVSVLGVFCDNPPSAGDGPANYRLLGNLRSVVPYVRSHSVDDVVIALPWSADEEILTLMAGLRELPVNAYLSSDLIGFRLPFRPAPDHFDGMPLVEVMGRPLQGWGGVQKALLDYCLAPTLIVLFLPLMLLIALAIKLESKGPVLFKQQRYGFVNKVFWIWKFRTMRQADGVPAKNVQAKRDDPRVTRVGRFLRRSSLDELPQLFNVLNGTMSLVGPRPHAIDHNEEYAQLIRGYFARHRVKPGMTGWAQVNGLRGATDTVEKMEARVKHDTYYTENWSLPFDLKILAMTLVVLTTGRNAY